VTQKQLLSADEVADMLGVATSTLAKWRQTGEPDLPYLRIMGHVRYRLEDIYDFIDDVAEVTEDDASDDNDSEDEDEDD
jgi:predicted site-specific integrase-resolvase